MNKCGRIVAAKHEILFAPKFAFPISRSTSSVRKFKSKFLIRIAAQIEGGRGFHISGA